MRAQDLFGRFEGHGHVTLAASDGRQRSVELTEVGHGAFTYYLAKGLRGEADADGDGVVTVEKLWAYLRGEVRDASGRVGNPQTPMLIGAMTHDVADGGYLPTEAEWNYAATGGDEQRAYPWSKPPGSLTRDATKANYTTSIVRVGSKPAGDGRWGSRTSLAMCGSGIWTGTIPMELHVKTVFVC